MPVCTCRECLERLLGLDDLEVNEGTAFSAALSWAEAALERKQEEISAKNVRCELGGALYLIRFPSMTFETLQERVLPTCVLSAEEEKAVVEYKRRQRASAAPFASLGRRRRLHRFKVSIRGEGGDEGRRGSGCSIEFSSAKIQSHFQTRYKLSTLGYVHFIASKLKNVYRINCNTLFRIISILN